MNNRITIIFLLMSLMVLAPSAAFTENNAGQLIETIEVHGLRTIDKDEFIYLMGLEQGAELDDNKVTKGIKRAFRKGIFNGIDVDAVEDRIVVTVKERDLLERINIKPRHLPKRELLRTLGLKKGDYVTSEIIKGSVLELNEFIREKGYPDFRVTYDIKRLIPDNLVELNIEIDEGPPSMIDEIVVFGRPAQEVARRLHLGVGERFDSSILKQDIKSLKEYYTTKGYIAPEIGPVEFVNGRLVLRVKVGRRLNYVVRIIKHGTFFPELTDKAIIDMMPFLDEGEINDDLLSEGVERIIEEYRSRGFSDVQVAPVIKASNGEVEVRLYISEGRIKVVRSFSVISDGEVESENISRILNNRKGNDYKPFMLDDDALLVREFYSALGYRDVEVSEPRTKIDGEFVEIEVDVRRGKKYVIGGVLISGNQPLPGELERNHIYIKPGDTLNEVDILSSRREAQSVCRREGYYYCTVQVSREYLPEGVFLNFEMNKGEKFFFGRTIISGNRLIRTETIRKHLKYRDGEPLDHEKLIQTRQRLLGLGVFLRADAEVLFDGNNSPDIHITVDEISPGKVDFGVGYGEYERFRTFMEIGYRNLFSDTDIASMRLEASSLWRRYILNYTQPYFMGSDFTSRTILLREEKEQKNHDTGETSYRVIKNAARTGLEKDINKKVSASLFYEYSIVDTFDVEPDIILSKEDVGTVAISSLSPAIYYNTQNDPFDPTRGALVGLTVKDAAAYLLSESEFTKISLKANAYKRAGSRVVAAISLGGGMAETKGGTESIPVVERFYLGGRNSVRGYVQDSLGPTGADGVAIGGNYFLLANLEFRIRLIGSWRTVLFGDCGNVWIEKSDVSTSDLRCSAGTGLRYMTPVGPLRLDYGWKLKRLEGETPGELHFSIGHVF